MQIVLHTPGFGSVVMSLLDFSSPLDAAAPRLCWAFGAARQTFEATQLGELRAVIDAAEAAARAGAWVLGGLCYEAAPAFDAALQVQAPQPGQPLAWFAVYDEPQPWPQVPPAASAEVDWQAQPVRADFDAALAHIQQGIAAGAYYQVNYTGRLQGQLTGAPQALFAALQQAQPGGYAAHIDCGAGRQWLSVSPELFFHWQAGVDGSGAILTRPMKGTAARGADAASDAAQAAQLRTAPKERAENVMIVDLLRNDLARIAQPHSVQVPRLFHTEALATVWQMTSDVQAHTRVGTRLWDVFAALFPCGSVTGAPKVQAMRAIAALETAPRGLYCGALGLLRPTPERGAGTFDATFNVPIRTLQLQGTALQAGIGSGIVWGADSDAEWREWQAKQAFLERARAPFALLETLALEEGCYRHLQAHLARLSAAAAHFAYPLAMPAVQQQLDALAQQHPQGLWRVRLQLDAQGRCQIESQPLAATSTPVRLALAAAPLALAHSEWVRFKTTRRAHYAAFAPAPGSGVFDTILYNSAGEITETTFGNIAALLDGRWLTPPLACGLLPGVGRAQALASGRVQEGVVRLQDVPRVQDWAFINSLRGWLPAHRV